jgi:hypothetical protein
MKIQKNCYTRTHIKCVIVWVVGRWLLITYAQVESQVISYINGVIKRDS